MTQQMNLIHKRRLIIGEEEVNLFKNDVEDEERRRILSQKLNQKNMRKEPKKKSKNIVTDDHIVQEKVDNENVKG